jgi:hypothetical protein
MRPFVCLILFAGLSPAEPPAGSDPQAILRRAIEAHGGADKLDRMRLVREHTAGVLHLSGKQVAFTAEAVQRLPNQYRHSLTSEVGGKKLVVVQVYDGKQGWLQEGGLTRAVDGKALAGWKATAHAAHVATLTPLLAADKGYRLTVLPEEKVHGRSAVGIKVTHEDHRDVALFFDRQTGLLVKKVLRPHPGGPESVQEEVYSDFKSVSGLKRPSRVQILLNGVPHVEGSIRETVFLDKVEDKEFTKP